MALNYFTVRRRYMQLCALAGFTAVAFGAFGAHGLKGHLAAAADGTLRLEWWQTAAQYHLAHALALGLLGSWPSESSPKPLALAGWSFCVGIVLFSGSLYVMALTGLRAFGAVTPLGGLAFLSGWVWLFLCASRGRST